MAALIVEDGTGLATANSYISVADADTYFEKHLNATDWTGNAGTQIAALQQASRVLDASFDFMGRKKTSTQALQWPRYDVVDRDGWYQTDIPATVIEACAELAMWLLRSDREAERDEIGFKELTVEGLTMRPDATDRPHVIPAVVSRMIGHYGRLRGSGTTKVVR